MARIRTIKPEFFTSEDIVSLSPLARLLYVALWCEADKEGRLNWKPATFKLRYFPGDNCKIEALCNELLGADLVVLYGQGYAHIPKFTTHQHVNPRESASVLPHPGDEQKKFPKNITDEVRQAVMDRDGMVCVRCASQNDLTLDHILPQSLGGPHIAENLRCMCRACNSGRPVAGDALVKDLARDGHTVQSLRDKFGIDASARVGTRANQDLTHREEGKGRKGRKGKEGATRRDPIAELWEAWPASERKQDKAKCEEKLKTILKAEPDLLDAILADIAIKKLTDKWRGGFIEAPLVYLNGRRWEDGVTPGSQAGHSEAGFI